MGLFCEAKLKYFKKSKLTPTNRIPGRAIHKKNERHEIKVVIKILDWITE